MSSPVAKQFIEYLQQELNISEEAIEVACRQSAFSLNQFTIVLWQLGFISLEQLDRIFDWLEQVPSSEMVS
ncbi:MAG: DUF2949 domain-containing protein [Cyanobacteria bacterium P01_F01_bin.42]